MKLGLVVWTSLVCTGLVQSRGIPREKRDADAAVRAGHDWFTSFYTLFQDEKNEKATAAETTPATPKNPEVLPVVVEGTTKPPPASHPHPLKELPHPSSSGHQHASTSGGSGSLPTEPFFPETVDVGDKRPSRFDGKFKPLTPIASATPSATPTNKIGTPTPGKMPSTKLNDALPVPEDPATPLPTLPVEEPTPPVEEPTPQVYPPSSPYTEPAYNDNNNYYYNNNYNYNNQQDPNVRGGPAYTDSGNWYNNFDTNYIYDTYNMNQDYSFGNNQQPRDWYYDANQGYTNPNYYEQPQAFSGFGFGNNAGGAGDFSTYQDAQALSGNEMGPDEDNGQLFGFGNELDASQFVDDFDLTRSGGLLQDPDQSTGFDATDPSIYPGMENESFGVPDPSMESDPWAETGDLVTDPSDPSFDPTSPDYVDPNTIQDQVYYSTPNFDPTLTLPLSGESGGMDDFMPSADPDAVLAALAGLFDKAETPVEELVDPYAIPNRPAKPAMPNKGVVDVPLNPDALGFSLEAPDVKLPKEECHTASGAIGECLSAFDCGAEDGEMDGLCHQGNDAYYHLRSCCIFNSHCGFRTNKEVTYLKNPNYPNRTMSGGDCIFKVDLLPDVCQVRLDFLELELKPMAEGECEDQNALHISSNDPGAFIPVKKLCGTISPGVEDSLRSDIPHMYVHVDRDAAAMGLLNHRPPNKDDVSVKLVLKVDDFSSKWNIRVSQISCDGANLQAPTGCGQYFNSNKGNISSFNFKDGQYMKGIRLSSCIKRDPTACGVEYNFKHFGIGETKGGQGKLGYGLTCKDYLLVNGEKTALCGSQNLPRRMIFPAHGPEHIFFSSDEQYKNKVDVGYSLEYNHLRNCTGVEFFKYPVKK